MAVSRHEPESDLLSVTMSREAAERFKKALLHAEAVVYPVNMDEADWLRWAISRVDLAIREQGS